LQLLLAFVYLPEKPARGQLPQAGKYQELIIKVATDKAKIKLKYCMSV
jgi:hypothetical protein